MVVLLVTSVLRRPHPVRRVRNLSSVSTARYRGNTIDSFLKLDICVLGVVF